jgi:hypothetical protein
LAQVEEQHKTVVDRLKTLQRHDADADAAMVTANAERDEVFFLSLEKYPIFVSSSIIIQF